MRKYILTLCLSVITLLAFASCALPTDNSGQAAQHAQEDMEGVFHQFDSLGFSVVFPAFWEGKYGTEESYAELYSGTAHFVSIYHIATREEIGEGRLLTLGRVVGEHFTYDDAPIMAGGSIFLAQTGGYTYFANFPSDVQHNYSDPNSESSAEYLEMAGHWESNHWDFLADSFRLMD